MVVRDLSSDSPQGFGMSNREVQSPYLTAAEAVIYLRLGSLSALYRLVREHRLPHGRRGRLHLFDKRDLDAWIRGTTAIELLRKRA